MFGLGLNLLIRSLNITHFSKNSELKKKFNIFLYLCTKFYMCEENLGLFYYFCKGMNKNYDNL